MKKLIYCTFFILAFATANAQQNSDLLAFNQLRLQKTQKAMTILGGWAVVNIGAGIALQANSSGEDKYFHQMNAIWNGINLAIALPGYFGARRTDPASFDYWQTVEETHKFQKILLFNAGLDLGYVAGGAYLWERGKNQAEIDDQDRFKGWGKSMMLQGGFLFVFDVITAWALSRDNPKLRNLMGGLSFNGNELGFKLRF